MARLFTRASAEWIDLGTAAPDPTSTCSIALWVLINSVNLQFLLARDDNTNGRSFAFGVNNSPQVSYLERGSAGQVALGTGSILTGAGPGGWHHVGLTLSSGSVQLYLDGATDGSAFGSAGPFPGSAGTTLAIGARTFSGSENYWDGKIADVAIWSSALTGTDFSNMAAGRRANTRSPGTLIGYWPLLSSDAASAPDYSGNSHNGTLHGTTTTSDPPSLDPFGGGGSASQILTLGVG